MVLNLARCEALSFCRSSDAFKRFPLVHLGLVMWGKKKEKLGPAVCFQLVKSCLCYLLEEAICRIPLNMLIVCQIKPLMLCVNVTAAVQVCAAFEMMHLFYYVGLPLHKVAEKHQRGKYTRLGCIRLSD